MFPRRVFRKRSASWWTAWLGSLWLAAGCARETGPVCYPVRGTLVYNQRPLAEAMILLHPLDPEATGFPKPLAYSDQDGRFEMTTLRSRDGAPAGRYTVTVELRELRPDGDELVRDGRNLLPNQYRDPATSGFQFEVFEEENEIPTLELQGP